MTTKHIDYSISTPGKVILFGEHSVVYKKAAVSTSISRRLQVDVRSNNQGNVCVSLAQINTKLTCDLDQFKRVVQEELPLPNPDSVSYINNPDTIDYSRYLESLKANLNCLGINTCDLQDKTSAALLGFLFVARGLLHNLNSKLVPFTLEVSSELDIGAGTGSSASYAVAITGSIYQLRKILEANNSTNRILISGADDRVRVPVSLHHEKSGFSTDELKLINKWAFCIEKIMHGRPSGIDNTTCTYGSIVITSQDENSLGELAFRVLDNVPSISILLISTGVSRNTSALVVQVRQLRANNHAAVDAIFNAMDVIALEAFQILNALGSVSTDDITRFGRHMDTASHYEALGELMDLNHGLLRTLGVSHESLERIVSVSKRHGLASKLTGAGGGGYAIALLPPSMPRDTVDQLRLELGEPFTVTEIKIAQEGIRLENR